jgi:hypothetical protein
LRDTIDRLAARLAELETGTPPSANGIGARLARIEAALAGRLPMADAASDDDAEDELRRVNQELRLVARERDALLGELNRIDGMQSDTIAFDEPGEQIERQADTMTGRNDNVLPSIDELIALNAGDGPWERAAAASEPEPGEGAGGTGWHELLPADMIVAQTPSGSESVRRKFAEQSRWRLVRTDVEPQEEFALDEPLVTVGRSPSADIQIDTGYISRIHARLLRIDTTILLEDAGSKNGVKINGERVERWPLKHGDMLQIGAVPFRFVDLDAGD